MYESHGWWFPDTEDHFPKMLAKSVSKGGPTEYQYQVRNRSFGHAKQTRVALDIGANVGLWSRDLVKHFDAVIAFEPVAMFRECLIRNVFATNLEVREIALGNQEGMIRMIITEGNTGHTHVDPDSKNGDTQITRCITGCRTNNSSLPPCCGDRTKTTRCLQQGLRAVCCNWPIGTVGYD